ncbi:MAG: tRNA (adenosine(37)-N6)-dimethylallyltransferase MiaA [Candidatus Paceibacterota bacterium]
METNPKVLVVVGPTASGKSDFAVNLAINLSRVNSRDEVGNTIPIQYEIISADSRQVYKGLDIGTGKITEEEMKGVVHHMLSVYELHDEVSVARYARDTTPILADILSRGKTPIICGGTGQYIDALIFDTTTPPVPPNQKLREELEMLSSEELVARLTTRDPIRSGNIDPHNRVRLIRALEIVDALGTVPAQTTPTLLYDTEIYLMNPTRELLRERITKRLESRLAIGMIEEVRDVMSKGYTSNDMKKFGLEYVTIGKYLEGALSPEEMKEELVTKSMQYAKRQQTWNKKYAPLAHIIEVK